MNEVPHFEFIEQFWFNFQVNNCLKFPQGNEIGKNRTPSHRYPSDHFSLLCDFEIIDSDDENNDDGDLTNNCL